MIEARHQSRFSQRIVRRRPHIRWLDQLDRDIYVEGLVMRSKDLPERAATQAVAEDNVRNRYHGAD
jgi:hypothetical protein